MNLFGNCIDANLFLDIWVGRLVNFEKLGRKLNERVKEVPKEGRKSVKKCVT